MAIDSGAEEGAEESALILAPTSKDAALCCAVLGEAGVRSIVTRDMAELCEAVERGAGVAVLSEEALTMEGIARLHRAVGRQPAWSDFPILVLTEQGADSEAVLRTLEILGNVTLLERPVRVPALVSAVRVSLRARRRQYQIRGLLAESQRVAESLREADRRKDEFLAILAHELRNPLAPMRNAVEAMRRRPEDRSAADWARGLIERQLAQMVRLIDDLLDLSRVSNGRIELRHEDVELADLVRDALETCRPAIAEGGHRLNLELPPTPVRLRGDPTRLVQVLCNLLHNAVKYTPQQGNITLAARADDTGVEIAVRDEGIGIPPEMLPRVFEMFTQVDRSLERSRGGLGIGLTLVKRLVEMHGGTVRAASAGPGLGSEFIVRLPAATAQATEAEPARPETFAGDASQGAVPQRILIADDNRDAADSLAVMLRMGGHDVRTAYDGEEALEAADSFRPGLALLDIGMPRLNGYDTARALRRRPYGSDVVLVALTGWGQPEDKQRSQQAGFDHHLVKPVDPSLIERLVGSPG